MSIVYKSLLVQFIILFHIYLQGIEGRPEGIQGTVSRLAKKT